MTTMQLSEHFSLTEATLSSTAERLGTDNSCSDQVILAAALKTAARLEAVRALLGFPLHIDSWIRCLELNRALKSKDTSQHVKGEAVDFLCEDYGTPVDICRRLLAYKELIRWDQLILEHRWVHISWSSVPNAQQRGEVLSLLSTGGYASGLTDVSGNPIK